MSLNSARLWTKPAGTANSLEDLMGLSGPVPVPLIPTKSSKLFAVLAGIEGFKPESDISGCRRGRRRRRRRRRRRAQSCLHDLQITNLTVDTCGQGRAGPVQQVSWQCFSPRRQSELSLALPPPRSALSVVACTHARLQGRPLPGPALPLGMGTAPQTARHAPSSQ